ncbi:MAG TPA: DUF6788 family protein, partial [Pseudonocardiaceae bacterium]
MRKAVAARLASYDRAYRDPASRLATVGYIASGSVAQRYNRCGKPNCGCHADPPRLHGPYWHWTAKVDGKTVNKRLTEREARLYREWIANDRQARSLLAEMRAIAAQSAAVIIAEDADWGLRSPAYARPTRLSPQKASSIPTGPLPGPQPTRPSCSHQHRNGRLCACFRIDATVPSRPQPGRLPEDPTAGYRPRRTAPVGDQHQTAGKPAMSERRVERHRQRQATRAALKVSDLEVVLDPPNVHNTPASWSPGPVEGKPRRFRHWKHVLEAAQHGTSGSQRDDRLPRRRGRQGPHGR